MWAKLEQKAAINNSAVPFQAGLPDVKLEIDDEDIGYGFNLATLLTPWSGTRFGLTYRSKIDLEFRDAATLKDIGPVLQGLLNITGVANKKVDIDMTIPQWCC